MFRFFSHAWTYVRIFPVFIGSTRIVFCGITRWYMVLWWVSMIGVLLLILWYTKYFDGLRTIDTLRGDFRNSGWTTREIVRERWSTLTLFYIWNKRKVVVEVIVMFANINKYKNTLLVCFICFFMTKKCIWCLQSANQSPKSHPCLVVVPPSTTQYFRGETFGHLSIANNSCVVHLQKKQVLPRYRFFRRTHTV